MLRFITEFINFVRLIFVQLDELKIYSTDTYSVSFLQVCVVGFLFSIAINIFWKGGQA